MEIIYRRLTLDEIEPPLFQSFRRYQKVSRCWRKENGKWILKDNPFIEEWGKKEYLFLIKCLKHTVASGGAVFGAFSEGSLVGFSSLESERFGSEGEYLQLSCLHVSYEYRGQGIGKKLFLNIAWEAKKRNAKKIYISAHSAEETQKFYHAMHCIEAKEYNKELAEAEPCDCQLEYVLGSWGTI